MITSQVPARLTKRLSFQPPTRHVCLLNLIQRVFFSAHPLTNPFQPPVHKFNFAFRPLPTSFTSYLRTQLDIQTP
jgi:hypothetical protein